MIRLGQKTITFLCGQIRLFCDSDLFKTFSTLIFKLTSISVPMSQKCLIGLKRITRGGPLASMLIYLNVRLLVEAVYNLCFTATFNTSPSLVRVVGKIMRGRLEPRVMTENHENS